jgi:hypothetical protein
LHLGQDVDHGLWLEEALARYADDARQQHMIRRGALLSLAARAKFWSGVQDKIVRWRQPHNVHLRTQSRREKQTGARERTLRQFRQQIAVWRQLRSQKEAA